MRSFVDRLRGRKAKTAEETLTRLDEQSEKGPEAAQRFQDAARRLMAVPKAVVEKRARAVKRRRGRG